MLKIRINDVYADVIRGLASGNRIPLMQFARYLNNEIVWGEMHPRVYECMGLNPEIPGPEPGPEARKTFSAMLWIDSDHLFVNLPDREPSTSRDEILRDKLEDLFRHDPLGVVQMYEKCIDPYNDADMSAPSAQLLKRLSLADDLSSRHLSESTRVKLLEYLQRDEAGVVSLRDTEWRASLITEQ